MPFTLHDKDIIMIFNWFNPLFEGLYMYVKTSGEKTAYCFADSFFDMQLKNMPFSLSDKDIIMMFNWYNLSFERLYVKTSKKQLVFNDSYFNMQLKICLSLYMVRT